MVRRGVSQFKNQTAQCPAFLVIFRPYTWGNWRSWRSFTIKQQPALFTWCTESKYCPTCIFILLLKLGCAHSWSGICVCQLFSSTQFPWLKAYAVPPYHSCHYTPLPCVLTLLIPWACSAVLKKDQLTSLKKRPTDQSKKKTNWPVLKKDQLTSLKKRPTDQSKKKTNWPVLKKDQLTSLKKRPTDQSKKKTNWPV